MSTTLNLRAKSRVQFDSESDEVTIINCGSFQRIADAVEKMAENYDRLLRAKKSAEDTSEYLRKDNLRMAHRIAGLKGYIKRARRAGK